MKLTAADLPSSPSLHDTSLPLDATLTDRAQSPEAAEAAKRAVLGLPQLSVAAGEEAELVVEGVLGRGGMGIVHVARQRALDREVAIKRVRPEGERRGAAIASLLSEARVQGALEHPNVVPIHALGRDENGLPVLVMKRLAGVSWRTLIRNPSHPAWPKAAGDRLSFHLETLMQVCNAVHFAHSHGVIHRDIKPENVMIGAFGEVYLLDWGVAYRLGSEDAIAPAIVGSPAYLASEMLLGTGPHLSPKTDVYLLGATLHEALTGKVRHDGDSVAEVLYDVADSAPYPYPPSVPAELAALCNQATHRDPEARPESALAFRQAIAEFLRHRGSLVLAEASAARFGELREKGGAVPVGPASDPERHAPIRKLYAEAYFGFIAALSEWEGNEAAREGAEALRTWMIDYELSHLNVEGAAALLAEVRDPPAAFVARIEALRVELAREREELARLRNAAQELDPLVLPGPRVFLLMVLGLLIAGLLVGIWRLRPAGPSHEDIAFTAAGIEACLVGTMIACRKVLLTTLFNRQLLITTALVIGEAAVSHAAGALLGLPVDPLIFGDLIADAGITATLATFMPRGFRAYGVVPCFFLIGAVIVGLFPRLALPTLGGIAFLVASSNALLFWYWLRREERSTAR